MAERLYRPCVGIVLINGSGKVFNGRRSAAGSGDSVDDSYAWQLPQGGIDPGEEPLAAARRELYEETNVRSASLLMEAPDWLSYDLPREVLDRSWKGRYIGQTQKWFAFRFDGEDGEIDVRNPAGGAHRPEFATWRWERIDALPELIIPFKRDVYTSVVATFRHLCESD